MAAQAGRNLRIKYDPTGGTATDAAVIAGARTESLTINRLRSASISMKLDAACSIGSFHHSASHFHYRNPWPAQVFRPLVYREL